MRIQCSCFDDSKRRRTGHRRRFFSWRRPHWQRKSRKMTTRMDDDDEDVYEDSNKRNIITFYFTYVNTRSLTHTHTKWFITFIIFIQIRNMIYYPYDMCLETRKTSKRTTSTINDLDSANGKIVTLLWNTMTVSKQKRLWNHFWFWFYVSRIFLFRFYSRT